jgi:hypothetical protein
VSARDTFVRVRVAEVAPGMSAPSFRHWYESVPSPVASTEKVAVPPESTAWSAGCCVISGAPCTWMLTVAVSAPPLLVASMR